MQDYKNLKIWQRAHELTLLLYKITKDFPREESFGMTSQLRRSITSVPANIAEGAGRYTKPDFAQFLNIALGSLNESSYYIYLAKELNYITIEQHGELDNKIKELVAMLVSFINTIRKNT